jgi:SAM-dependent methyltransferase
MTVAETKSFFYAENDADLYDSVIRLTTEPYDLLHAQVRRLVAHWKSARRGSSDERCLIVDIGCGTGAEALGILREIRHANLVCIDLSDRMLEILRGKIKDEFGDETAGGRCWTIKADFRDDNFLSRALDTAGFPANRISLAVSVYALHHLVLVDKEELYRSIAKRLAADGVFICGDMYAFYDGSLAAYAQLLEEKWIKTAFQKSNGIGALNGHEIKRLTDEWLEHSRCDNNPLPISSNIISLGRTDHSGVEETLLNAAGFKRVEVPFRFFQNGVIWAEV